MIKSISKSKLAKIIVFFILIFTVSNFSFAVEKVKIEQNLEKFLEKLSNERKDFEYVEYKIDESDENKNLFDEVTTKLKLVKGTPIIYLNGHIIQGFNTSETTGKEIIRLIDEGKKADKIFTLKEYVKNGKYENVTSNDSICQGEETCKVPGLTKEISKQVLVNIPFINKSIDLTDYSLPLMSLILGTVDGFNPCAMWVLVLFLTALIAVGNKIKMFRVAGLFILAEAVMYYLILNAWLYTWDFVGLDKWVTPIVGVVGIIGGIFFVKNYFKKELIGFGDIKLMMGIGGNMGYKTLAEVVKYYHVVYFIAGITVILFMLYAKYKGKKAEYIPFAPFLATGFIMRVLNIQII